MNSQRIDQAWPSDELENVDACPYCAATDRTLAYKDVQDWSFYGAAGKWSYWNCSACEALYLNPRPTEASIGKAYTTYYTHSAGGESLFQRLKLRLKNECLFHWVGADVSPRLRLPAIFAFFSLPLKKYMYIPFDLACLVKLAKGKLLDVGCGSGGKLLQAKQLGWDTTGLEIDPNAVKVAKEAGLNVIQGDFHQLERWTNEFDCIVCSHVLEHVHKPVELLMMISNALKPKGILILSLPNAKSHVRDTFGDSWRGLEAPRHLGIPSLEKMLELLKNLNYTEIKQFDIYNSTISESIRIMNNRSINYSSIVDIKHIAAKNSPNKKSDFIQIIAKKA